MEDDLESCFAVRGCSVRRIVEDNDVIPNIMEKSTNTFSKRSNVLKRVHNIYPLGGGRLGFT